VIVAELLSTAHWIPARQLDNAEVGALFDPPIDPAEIGARTGIETRHWAAPGTRLADVGALVLGRALDAADMAPTELDRIIFASAAGGDWISPATANGIAHALGLRSSCDCFDINNACTAFLTGLDLACRSVATGSGPVAVVIVEINSDIIDRTDARTTLIFGDAAAAAIVGPGHPDAGVLGVHLRNDGSHGKTIFMDHPRWSGAFHPVEFGLSNKAIVAGALELLSGAVSSALSAAGMALAEVDWVLPHQPNGRLLDHIVAALGVDRSRMLDVVREVGSTGAAAVPVSLDRIVRSRGVQAGDTLLLLSIGGGVGYGAIVLRAGPALSRLAGLPFAAGGEAGARQP
jgi:3-oxoacyl-(acyl-carrier-protein) synthase III